MRELQTAQMATALQTIAYARLLHAAAGAPVPPAMPQAIDLLLLSFPTPHVHAETE